MKYLQRLIGLLVISAAIFSCQKEYSVETPAGASANGQWEFKEAGVLFKGTIDTVSVDTINTYTFFTLVGRSSDGGAQMTLQVFGKDLKPGTYKTPFSLFAYIKGATTVYQTDQAATDSFTIVITKADSTGIVGTFRGKASGKEIVDGKFSAPFKTSAPVTPTTKDSGQAVLWSKAGCGGGTSTSPITVTVNGKTGQITKFFAAEPTTCDPPGSYFIKLPVGTYQWVAKCASDSVTGALTITKGGCTKTEVNFSATPVPTGDYFPMTTASNWTYLYESSTPDDTLFTFSLGNTKTFGGKIYNMFTNTDGQNKDTSYYRKAGNSYYEYVFATSEKDSASGITLAFPAYEYTFLVDNLTANQTFSNTYSGTATSPAIPIPAAITASDKTTILVTGATVTVSGKTYTNVIKTKTIYSFTAGGTTNDIYGVEQWFSKGVGLIKYIDYTAAPFTTPDYIKNITRYVVK